MHVPRIIVWFSCGAASAVTLREAVRRYPARCVVPVYCNTAADEHPDNARFRRDVENWLGVKIQVISSWQFKTCDEVFEATRYISGPRGARCTTADKKELKRIEDFKANNFELKMEWLLRDAGITKQACFSILTAAGIALPAMYALGYRNNNCIGCVKSSSPGYWQKILQDFPERFWSRARRSRELGVRMIEFTNIKKLPAWALKDSIKSGKKTRVFLDVLDGLVSEGFKFPYKGENLSCGPECGGGSL